MIDIIGVVFPVFFLIALGYAAAKGKLIRANGTKGLNDFVLYFCVPALLFRTMQSVDLGSAEPLSVWGAYYIGAAAIWLIAAVAARRVRGLGGAGGSATAFASTFGNVGMIGLSIAYLSFGEEGVVVAAMIIALHAASHWLFGSLWAEWSARGRGVPLSPMLIGVFKSLTTNPILVALAAGAAWKAGGIATPAVAERIIGLLADAAIPVGLFALGLSVAAYPLRGNLAGVATIIALKMALFPAIAWTLAVYVFALPPMQATIVTLLAALPTGVNPYLFATKFNASVPAVSGAIALGVMISILTIPTILWLTGGLDFTR